MSAPLGKELARFPYYDQSNFPMEYVAFKRDEEVSRTLFIVYMVNTGEPLSFPIPEYNTASTEREILELAFRHAHDLPIPRILFCGKNWEGVSNVTARIWIAERRERLEKAYKLDIVSFKRIKNKYQVYGTPNDWLELNLTMNQSAGV